MSRESKSVGICALDRSLTAVSPTLGSATTARPLYGRLYLQMLCPSVPTNSDLGLPATEMSATAYRCQGAVPNSDHEPARFVDTKTGLLPM